MRTLRLLDGIVRDFGGCDDTGKPRRPKEVFEGFLRRLDIPRCNALYQRLAQKESLPSCATPSFLRLRDLLRNWFPVLSGAGRIPGEPALPGAGSRCQRGFRGSPDGTAAQARSAQGRIECTHAAPEQVRIERPSTRNLPPIGPFRHRNAGDTRNGGPGWDGGLGLGHVLRYGLRTGVSVEKLH